MHHTTVRSSVGAGTYVYGGSNPFNNQDPSGRFVTDFASMARCFPNSNDCDTVGEHMKSFYEEALDIARKAIMSNDCKQYFDGVNPLDLLNEGSGPPLDFDTQERNLKRFPPDPKDVIPPVFNGRFTSDGSVHVTCRGLFRTPRDLARTLIHELPHYMQQHNRSRTARRAVKSARISRPQCVWVKVLFCRSSK